MLHGPYGQHRQHGGSSCRPGGMQACNATVLKTHYRDWPPLKCAHICASANNDSAVAIMPAAASVSTSYVYQITLVLVPRLPVRTLVLRPAVPCSLAAPTAPQCRGGFTTPGADPLLALPALLTDCGIVHGAVTAAGRLHGS